VNKNEVSKESQLMKLPFVFFLIASVTQLSAQSCFDLYGLHPLDSTPSAIISGDFDEDGYSDLAVANIASFGNAHAHGETTLSGSNCTEGKFRHFNKYQFLLIFERFPLFILSMPAIIKKSEIINTTASAAIVTPVKN